nr:MAG TPA: hypothetical protein [Caudoviricetes sp.]
MREWPPLDPPRERKGPCPLTPHIGSFYLEELHALRNQVRCTWLRHEPLRIVTCCNRALLREARVTFVWRQTACGGGGVGAGAVLLRSPRFSVFCWN